MNDVIELEPVPGWRGRAQHGRQMTLTSYEIAAGAPEVHEHQHPEEEAWTVIEGELVVWIEARNECSGRATPPSSEETCDTECARSNPPAHSSLIPRRVIDSRALTTEPAGGNPDGRARRRAAAVAGQDDARHGCPRHLIDEIAATADRSAL